MLYLSGKDKTKYRPGFTLQLPSAPELTSQNFHDLEAQGLALSGRQILGHADAVIHHRQIHPAILASRLDPDRSGSSIGKRVLERIGNQFIEDQPGGNGLIDAQNQWSAIRPRADHHLPRDARGIHAEDVEQIGHQQIRLLREMHLPEVGRLVQLLVDHGDGFHAVLAFPQNRGDGLVGGGFGLQTQQARDHLQVVLDAMMQLLEQNVLFRQGPGQAGMFLAEFPNQADFLRSLQNRQSQFLAGDAVFEQVVLRAGSHGLQGHLITVRIGQHDHGEGRFVEGRFQVQLSQKLQPGHIREIVVEQDAIGSNRAAGFQALGSFRLLEKL